MDLINSFSYFIHYEGKNINRIPPSKIEFHHLTFVLKGSFTYYVEGQKIELKENDAMLLVPGTMRERVFSSENVHFVLFNFTPTKGNEFKSNLFFKNAVNKTIRKLLDAYPYNTHLNQQTIQTTTPENEKICTVVRNIFNCILLELLDTLKYKTQNPHVLSAIKYINENITHPLSLQTISNALHITKEHIARLFKKEMNMTVTEYVNDQKLELANSMISIDELPLQEVAGKLGYENYCYFSKMFKKKFGISPLKLKKALKTMHN